MINQEDKDFLIAVADERIQLHYSKHLSEILPDKKHFLALDDRFQAALKQLNQEGQEAVQDYLEFLFHKSAATELVLYRAGVADGYKLANLIHDLE